VVDGRFWTGSHATKVQAFAVAMIGLYDHLPRLTAPYMTGCGLQDRRMIATSLSTIRAKGRGANR